MSRLVTAGVASSSAEECCQGTSVVGSRPARDQGPSPMPYTKTHANVVWRGGDEMPPLASAPYQPTCLAVIRRVLEPKTQPLSCTRSTLDSRRAVRPGNFSCREDAESFIEELRRDNPGLASDLRIEERELGARVPTRTDVPSAANSAGCLASDLAPVQRGHTARTFVGPRSPRRERGAGGRGSGVVSWVREAVVPASSREVSLGRRGAT